MNDLVERLRETFAGRYTIERELGRGGMATVLLARDEKHGRHVAIKVLRPELGSILGPDRFHREIAIAAQLRHPHILPLHDSGDADGLLYYVMPYVDGESLRERLIREGTLAEEAVIHIARDVAAALGYAHAHGVIHRDIKPENILVEGNEVVVADFGIGRAMGAASAETLTQTGIAIGTPAYMSPEQAAGEQHLDGRSDLYSLGCMIHEMLAGTPPFSGTSAQSIIVQHFVDSPPKLRSLRAGVSEQVECAVLRSLAKDPNGRFATAEDFVTALLRREPQPAASTPTDGSLARRDQRRSSHLGSQRRESSAPASVAVLYLDNLSGDTADAYLADGLTEEITSRLAELPRLRVKARSAVRRFRGVAVDDLAAVGRELGVRYMLEGSIRRAGSRIRVSVRLLRSKTGMNVWSANYDRTTEDLLVLQDDIAHQIAINIAGTLAPAEERVLAAWPTRDPRAYDHFLRGNYFLAQRSPSAMARAIDEFEAAVGADPEFTQALARIGHAYGQFVDFGWDYKTLNREEILSRGFSATDRALERDSKVADAWMARAYLLSLRHPRTFAGVRTAFERMLALEPRSAEPYHEYGWILRQLGEDSKAIEMYERALAIDSARPITLVHLADMMVLTRKFDYALQALDRAIVADDKFFHAYTRRAFCRLELGDIPGARADALTASQLGSSDYAGGEVALAVVDVREGNTAAAADRIHGFLGRHIDLAEPTWGHVGWISQALIELGRYTEALELLERIRPRGAELWSALRMPAYDVIRSFPRFQRLMDEARPVPEAS